VRIWAIASSEAIAQTRVVASGEHDIGADLVRFRQLIGEQAKQANEQAPSAHGGDDSDHVRNPIVDVNIWPE
jgi:hypothetical protein